MRATKTESGGQSYRKFFFLLVLFVVLPVLLLGVAPGVAEQYDRSHLMTVTCDVVDASPASTSSRSLRGIGATGVQVVIETSDCGKLLLQKGVSDQNAASLATELSRGRTHEFQVGPVAWNTKAITGLMDVSPEAYSYAPVS